MTYDETREMTSFERQFRMAREEVAPLDEDESDRKPKVVGLH